METEAMKTHEQTSIGEPTQTTIVDPQKTTMHPILIRLDPVSDASGTITYVPRVVHTSETVAPPTLAEEATVMTVAPQTANIGERVIMKLRVLRHKILRTMTTVSYLYEFRDMHGNIYQWLTHRNKGLEDGKEYYLKCTIKKFYKRRGVNIIAIT